MNLELFRGRRGEPHPELFDPPPAAGHTGGLTAAEAVSYARNRDRALRRVLRARRRLQRSATRLVTARLAVDAGAAAPNACGTPDGAATANGTAAVNGTAATLTAEAAPAGEQAARGLGIPYAVGMVLLGLITVVEFVFWLTLGRQSVRYDDYVSPAALQAVAMALVFPAVALAGALLASPVARLGLLPVGTRESWYRLRTALGLGLVLAMSLAMGATAFTRFAADSTELGARPLPVVPLAVAFALLPIIAMAVHAFSEHPAEQERAQAELAARRERAGDRAAGASALARRREHERAALALEWEIDRLLGRYHRDVARSDVGTLRGRAHHGQAGPYPTLTTGSGDTPGGIADAAPVSWLAIDLPPRLQAALQPSLRALAQHRPGGPA